MQLLVNTNNETNIETNIKLTLKYNKEINEKDNIIINEIQTLKNEITNLKISNDLLKKEILNLKKYHENNSRAKEIKFHSNIVDDSYAWVNLDNTFTVFKSINSILYLIYSNANKSIICYDLNNKKKINEIRNIHNEFITNLPIEINNRDLVMSISRNENNFKVWNIKNWECLLNINNINKVGYIYSACFFNDNSQHYVIMSNRNLNGNPEAIKIFNFNGQKIKEINNSNDHTFYIDTYYDRILNKNFIITGNFGYVKTYDYNKNELYYKYDDNKCYNEDRFHCSLIVKNNEKIIKIIESSGDGFIRIWNFHSGILLDKIKIGPRLYSICLWDDNYLFVGCQDNSIKLIELNNKLIVKSFSGHNNWVLTLKKIFHPIYGKCLLSQNWGSSQINIWNVDK